MQCHQGGITCAEWRGKAPISTCQARTGSGWLARSLHHRVVFSALVSELSAVAAMSSWHSLACSQYCVASLSDSWGFRLLLLQCRSEPRGSSPSVNNLWQRGHMGRGKVGWAGRAGRGQQACQDSWKCPLGCLVHGYFSRPCAADVGTQFPLAQDDVCSTQSCRVVRRDSHRPLKLKGLPHTPVAGRLDGKSCRIISCTPPNSCPPEHWSRGWHEVSSPPLREL